MSSSFKTNPKQCFTKNKVFGFAPFGGPEEIRTLDFYNANVALSQLSYRPIFLTALIIITRGEKKSNPNFRKILFLRDFTFQRNGEAGFYGCLRAFLAACFLGSTAPFVST